MDPVKLLLILVTAICYSTAGIINFSDLPIAPDRIYMKHKFMYLEVDEKHKGKLDVEIEITPQNFKEKFSFYLVIVNEELFDTFQKKHVNMEVCTEREDVSLPTYLELGTNVKDLLLNKHYTNNPNEKLIIEYTSNVTVNGMYYTVICVCPNKSEIPEKPTAGLYDYYVDKSKPFVKVSGTIKFKNPVGYLNGVQIPCARYYFFFCLAYIGLAVFWVYKIIQRKEYLIFFHHVISSVFVVSFLETWFIYINYDLYNKNGLRNSFFDYTAGSLTVIKMTSIILISIIVSLGYKITRKSIFEYTMRLIVLGFIYFICSIIFVGEKLYTTYTPIMLSTSLMLKLPFYIINAVAFVWILRALTNTIKILNQTKQSFKTKLFNNFFYGVCIILVILICTCVIQIVLLFMSKWNNIYNNNTIQI